MADTVDEPRYNIWNFFTKPPKPDQQLMDTQVSRSPVEVAGLDTITDPILPDRITTDRLGHFDPELYDLRDNSHLMRLIKVLLGGAGAGGLRKQITVARLHHAFHGMHFLDLDRFFGALFGIRRTRSELLPDFGSIDADAHFDPYKDATGSDAWDDIHSRDSSYRDRLSKFATTIGLGGTYAGIKAQAESLTSVDCEVYESWDWIDQSYWQQAQGRILDFTFASLGNSPGGWSTLEDHSWNDWGGGSTFYLGRTTDQTRSDVLVQPKRVLRVDEQYEMIRVLRRFAPAGVSVTVDSRGLAVHTPTAIRSVAASSEFWEIIAKLAPSDKLAHPATPTYAVTHPDVMQPRPPFSQRDGEEWSYNKDVTAVSTYTLQQGVAVPRANEESVTFPGGRSRTYLGRDAILHPNEALATRLASDGVMTGMPYAPGRMTTGHRWAGGGI